MRNNIFYRCMVEKRKEAREASATNMYPASEETERQSRHSQDKLRREDVTAPPWTQAKQQRLSAFMTVRQLFLFFVTLIFVCYYAVLDENIIYKFNFIVLSYT